VRGGVTAAGIAALSASGAVAVIAAAVAVGVVVVIVVVVAGVSKDDIAAVVRVDK
jgi:hypothetical protein